MRKPIIGIVCLVRKTFDYKTAFSLYQERTKKLMEDASIDWVYYPNMVIEPEEAKMAGEYFVEKHVDALIVVSATFHLGGLALILHNLVKITFWLCTG